MTWNYQNNGKLKLWTAVISLKSLHHLWECVLLTRCCLEIWGCCIKNVDMWTHGNYLLIDSSQLIADHGRENSGLMVNYGQQYLGLYHCLVVGGLLVSLCLTMSPVLQLLVLIQAQISPQPCSSKYPHCASDWSSPDHNINLCFHVVILIWIIHQLPDSLDCVVMARKLKPHKIMSQECQKTKLLVEDNDHT